MASHKRNLPGRNTSTEHERRTNWLVRQDLGRWLPEVRDSGYVGLHQWHILFHRTESKQG